MNTRRFREEMTQAGFLIEEHVWEQFKMATRETGASAMLRMFVAWYIKREQA
jgi:hypothetical protein